MWKPCRICGERVPGAQCRWLFGKRGRFQPAVVLARVLGCSLHRDGSSGLLCRKCVFLLDCVVSCDVAIEDLQKTRAAQLQPLRRERSRLSVLIAQKYWRNNSQEQDWCETHHSTERRTPRCKKSESKPWQSEAEHPEWPKRQQDTSQKCLMEGNTGTTRPGSKVNNSKESRSQRITRTQLGRSASLSFRQSTLAPYSGMARFKTESNAESHGYSDLHFRKYASPSRTISLSPSQAIKAAPRLGQTQQPGGSSSLLIDMLQLLWGIRSSSLPRIVGSRIPIQLKPSGVFGHPNISKARLARAEQAVRELEEEFNDEYLVLNPEVHSFSCV